MAKKSIDRTVQYWLLTDGRTDQPTGTVDWKDAIERWSRTRPIIDILGDEVQGVGHQVGGEWLGLTLSKVRDHVPKQGEFQSGTREQMQVHDGWHAIDDAFIYFCGPGNTIAVMAESLQATRINRIVYWLNEMLKPAGDQSDFYYSYQPVIDTFRRQKLEDAHGLKMVHFEGVFGKHTRPPGLIQMVLNQFNPQQIDGLKVEVKITREQKNGSASDEERVLDLLSEYLGPIDADTAPGTRGYDKFSVKPQGSATEIDLISQRLTRKKKVPLDTGSTQSIFADQAFIALAGASEADQEAIDVGIETMFERDKLEE